MFQATRRRLAIWYTAVTAILLILFASSSYLYVRNTLIERIDDTLKHVVEVVERSLVIESTVSVAGQSQFKINLEASFGQNVRSDAVDDDHIDLEWFDATGELLWSTLSEPLNVSLTPTPQGKTVRLMGHHWSVFNDQTSLVLPEEIILRQVTQPIQIGDQVLGYLRVSHPWFEVTKPIQQLLVDLTIGTILTLISISGMGWLLSGLAIQPIQASYQQLKQFTADVSHEFRNPIATLQTNVQVALDEPNLNPDEQQRLLLIERLTRRLSRLVDDLLFLARQDSGIVQPQWSLVPLDELLMQVVEEQMAIAIAQGINLSLQLIESEISLDQNPGEDLFTVTGDWDQLIRLFTNLVRNALQYTDAGGQVDVKVQRDSSSTVTKLWVTIQDNGCGMPTEVLPQIFDRFYRVDPARSCQKNQGSGLGLAIAQAIIINHQGQIQIESQLNQGTSVKVFLPQSQDPIKA